MTEERPATMYRVIETGVTSSPGPRAIDTDRPLLCMTTADEEELLGVDNEFVTLDTGVLVCDLPLDHDGPHWDEQDEMTWGLDL